MLYYRFISYLTKSALSFEINNILLKICIISSNQTCSLTYIQLLFNLRQFEMSLTSVIAPEHT